MENKGIDSLPQEKTEPVVLREQPKSNMLFLGIGAFVFIVIGLAGGYFLFGNKAEKVSQSTPQPASSVSNITNNQIADWKTYANATYGFSLQYPSTLKVSSNGDFGADLIDQNVQQEQVTPKNIKVRIGVNSTTRDFTKIYTAVDNAIIAGESHAAGATFTKSKSYIIGNYKAVNYLYEVPGNQTEKSTTRGTVIERNNDLIEISSWDPHFADFEKVISTIKFSDRKQSDNSSWRTYTLKTVGIRLSLPSLYPEMKEIVGNGQEGTQVCMEEVEHSFFFIKRAYAGGGCNSDWSKDILIGTVSTDYVSGRSSGFTDLLGFVEKDNKVYGRFLKGELVDLPSDTTKIVNAKGVEIVKIKMVIKQGDNPGMFGQIGDKGIGLLINSKNLNYPGLAIALKSKTELTDAIVNQIIDSVELTN